MNCILDQSRKKSTIDCETDTDSDNTVVEDQSDTDIEENDVQNDPNDDESNQTEDQKSTPEGRIVNNQIIRLKRKKKSKRKKTETELLVQCRSCGSYQHAVCVNFDIDKRRPYYCGHCWVRDGMKPVNSRATLIVSPRSISHQWQDEITKHVDCSNLSIFVYEGVKGNKG